MQWFTFSEELIEGACADLAQLNSGGAGSGTSGVGSGFSTPGTKERKAHKFFDSYPQYERRPADINAVNQSLAASAAILSASTSGSGGSVIEDGCITPLTIPQPKAYLNVPRENVIDSAHWGYVYCMATVPSPYEAEGEEREERIVTGSGDESIKLWYHTASSSSDPTPPTLLQTFQCSHGAVLSLISSPTGETIYAGCQDGYVKVWDLLTGTLVREILVQESEDVLSLSLGGGGGEGVGDLWTGSANGIIQRWSNGFDCLGSWEGHKGIVLSTIITSSDDGGSYLVSGANDGFIKVSAQIILQSRGSAEGFWWW